MLQNLLKTFNVAPPGRPGAETPETRERLRSLGYIGGGSAAARDVYTEADDPKRLIELEQTIQRAMEAYQQGRAGRGGRRCCAASSRSGRTPRTPIGASR